VTSTGGKPSSLSSLIVLLLRAESNYLCVGLEALNVNQKAAAEAINNHAAILNKPDDAIGNIVLSLRKETEAREALEKRITEELGSVKSRMAQDVTFLLRIQNAFTPSKSHGLRSPPRLRDDRESDDESNYKMPRKRRRVSKTAAASPFERDLCVYWVMQNDPRQIVTEWCLSYPLRATK